MRLFCDPVSADVDVEPQQSLVDTRVDAVDVEVADVVVAGVDA